MPTEWERPTLTEIKMDAEFTSYCDDLPPEPAEMPATPERGCGSAS